MRVQANFRALKFTFGLRLREKAKEMEREKCFVPLSLVAKHNLFIYRIGLPHKGFPNHEWSFTQELLSSIFWYCLRRTQIKSKIFPETWRGSFYILVFCFHGLLRHIFWPLLLPYVADAWKLLLRARTECATDTRPLSSRVSPRAPGSFLRPYYLQAPARQVTLVACFCSNTLS